jgi:hypothetical protein
VLAGTPVCRSNKEQRMPEPQADRRTSTQITPTPTPEHLGTQHRAASERTASEDIAIVSPEESADLAPPPEATDPPYQTEAATASAHAPEVADEPGKSEQEQREGRFWAKTGR